MAKRSPQQSPQTLRSISEHLKSSRGELTESSKTFGEELGRLIRAKQLTTRQAAAKLGVDITSLSNLRRDNAGRPGNALIVKISEMLGGDLEQLQSLALLLQPGLPDNWISALFSRMTAIYGRRWTDSFPLNGQQDPESVMSAAKAEWQSALIGVTGEQIKRGIEHCRDKLTFPPSISQFLEACGATSGEWQHAGPGYRVIDPSKLLPKKISEENEKIARESIEKMRRSLAESG